MMARSDPGVDERRLQFNLLNAMQHNDERRALGDDAPVVYQHILGILHHALAILEIEKRRGIYRYGSKAGQSRLDAWHMLGWWFGIDDAHRRERELLEAYDTITVLVQRGESDDD